MIMSNKVKIIIISVIVLVVLGIIILVVNDSSYGNDSGSDSTTGVIDSIENEDTSPKDSEEIDEVEYVINLTKKEQNMLLKLAFAEAGNQDVNGKALVMLVVLNRVESDKFPDNIYDVIHAKNQFSVVASGAYANATKSDQGCLEALELVMSGYDISEGATYFESIKSYDSWHYRNLEFLFEHGDHWFYK